MFSSKTKKAKGEDSVEIKPIPKTETIDSIFNVDRAMFMGLQSLKTSLLKSHSEGFYPTQLTVSFSDDFSKITFVSKAEQKI